MSSLLKKNAQEVESLIQSLHSIGAIKHGQFKLKSGVTSPIYINLRNLISYPRVLKAISRKIFECIETLDFDFLCGVPYSALALATCISLEQEKPMVLRRKEQKSYGLAQKIDGEFYSGQSCVVIEDVMTTGASILETILDLENVGLKVLAVVTVVDRGQGGKESLLAKGYPVFNLFSLNELLNA